MVDKIQKVLAREEGVKTILISSENDGTLLNATETRASETSNGLTTPSPRESNKPITSSYAAVLRSGITTAAPVAPTAARHPPPLTKPLLAKATNSTAKLEAMQIKNPQDLTLRELSKSDVSSKAALKSPSQSLGSPVSILETSNTPEIGKTPNTALATQAILTNSSTTTKLVTTANLSTPKASCPQQVVTCIMPEKKADDITVNSMVSTSSSTSSEPAKGSFLDALKAGLPARANSKQPILRLNLANQISSLKLSVSKANETAAKSQPLHAPQQTLLQARSRIEAPYQSIQQRYTEKFKKKKRYSEKNEAEKIDELRSATLKEFNNYLDFYNAVKQQALVEQDYTTLGAVSPNSNYYFNPNGKSNHYCKQFMQHFLNQENAYKEIINYYIKKSKSINSLSLTPNNISFIDATIEENGQKYNYCFISISSYGKLPIELKNICSNTVKYLNDTVKDCRFSMLDGNPDRISILIDLMLDKRRVEEINILPLRHCSEKYFTALLVKLFAHNGQALKINNITNCFLYGYDLDLDYGKGFRQQGADEDKITLANVTPENYYALMDYPYLRSNQSETITLASNKQVFLKFIPCCSYCKANKNAILKILITAQNYNAQLAEDAAEKNPTSPLFTSFEGNQYPSTLFRVNRVQLNSSVVPEETTTCIKGIE